jgi:hypothetical protein
MLFMNFMSRISGRVQLLMVSTPSPHIGTPAVKREVFLLDFIVRFFLNRSMLCSRKRLFNQLLHMLLYVKMNCLMLL